MASYNHLSKDNIALVGARDIGVYQNGKKVGRIPLGSLRQPNRERRLYSFGVISDPHIGANGAVEKFRRAITYFANDNDVSFVVNCGDLVAVADDKIAKLRWFQRYRDVICECSGGKSVFAIGGNHEQLKSDVIASFMKDYVGNRDVWYSKEVGDDFFLFLNAYEYGSGNGGILRFLRNDVRKIRDKLDENRNKRCFVFHHVPFVSGFEYDIDGDYIAGTLPRSLWQHYKNVTVFSGHTHSPFSKHLTAKGANFNKNYGIRSVHVPALCEHCEGYVIDVYEDGIHLRGLNFETGHIPIASYWVDTSLVDVADRYSYKGE